MNSLSNCKFNFLQGWQFDFWGSKIEPADFDDLQKYISGCNISGAVDAFVYLGAPDIVIMVLQILS